MVQLQAVDAVILCGGLGERLRSEIGEVPKVMASIGGHPFLNFLIDHLIVEGVKRVILCTGYKAENIEDYYSKAAFPVEILFSREEEALGTGGGLKHARELIQSDPFLVFNGDSFCPVDFRAFLDFHRIKNAAASIVLSKVEDTTDYGTVRVDKTKQVAEFKEKAAAVHAAPQAGLVNAGVYCLQKNIFELMPEGKQFSLEKDLFPQLIGKDFYGFTTEDRFIDIGTPQRYKQAQQLLRKDKRGDGTGKNT